MKKLKALLNRVHSDEEGAVSLETVLIVGAIALPILIFLLNYAWPRIREFFDQGMDQLETEANDVRESSDF